MSTSSMQAAIYLIVGTLGVLFLVGLATANIPSGYNTTARRKTKKELALFPFYMLILYIALTAALIAVPLEYVITRRVRLLFRLLDWFDRLVD